MVFLVTVRVTVVPAARDYNRPKHQQINRLKSQPMLVFTSIEYYHNSIIKWLWDDCCHWTSHQAQFWQLSKLILSFRYSKKTKIILYSYWKERKEICIMYHFGFMWLFPSICFTDAEGASVNYSWAEINQKKRGNMFSRELTSHIHNYFVVRHHGNHNYQLEKSVSWMRWTFFLNTLQVE